MTLRCRSTGGVLVVVALVVAAATGSWGAAPAGATVASGPSLPIIGCDQAATVITITRSTALDPNCTYSGGLVIAHSRVTLDCRGAHVDQGLGRSGVGILVTTPVTVGLSDITIRNCEIHGFGNGLRVTRVGFKSLAPGAEYVDDYARVRIQDVAISDTAGVGLYVDGYMTGVSINRLDVERAGSTGIYLEAGSKGTLVSGSTIADNGYANVSPDGVPVVAGSTLRVLYTGREGIAVDGSRDNVIRDNTIRGNSYGGVFLYENCGEDFTNDRADWWPRIYGASGNHITHNTISDEPNGVWIGSRMAENLAAFDCSTPPFYVNGTQRFILDHAPANLVGRNLFVGDTHGVRVEDDANRVVANRFVDATVPGRVAAPVEAILVGTQYRTAILSQPVTGTVIKDNRADLAGVVSPYTLIHDPVDTDYGTNHSGRLGVGLAPGVQPVINPLWSVIRIWLP